MNKRRYEYVEKEEYMPVKVQLNRIIQRANSFLRNNTEFSFEAHLVGSGKKNLITREIGGNKGFDFDYNLMLFTLNGQMYPAKYVNDCFMEAFRYAVRGTGWKDPEDSTSVLTIKVVDQKNSRINHSCDFAIVFYDTEGMLHYRHHYKDTGGYGFPQRPDSNKIDECVKTIRDYYSDGWGLIRDKYLQMKNNNRDEDKKSFMLYIEAVNALYYAIPEDEDDDSIMMMTEKEVNYEQRCIGTYPYSGSVGSLCEPA